MAYFIVRPQYKKSSSGGIYGVVWNGDYTVATLTRTDDAVGFSNPVPQMSDGNGGWTTGSSPFDNIMPWAGMVKVEDAKAGTLVAIPKFYFKLEYANPNETVQGLKLQISEKEFEGSHVSPAHMDRGDGKGERDVVYVGRYHCATSTYKSTSGVKPQVSKSRNGFRSSITNLGTGIWQWDYAMLTTIQMLYLVEFANWNSQTSIGRGNGASSIANMGASDSMTYHTGTVKSSINSSGVGVQYRNIEDLWANVNDYVDGIRFSGADTYITKNPANFSNTWGGVRVELTKRTDISSNPIRDYKISTVSGFEWCMVPYNAGTSVLNYFNGQNSSAVALAIGSRYGNTGTQMGLFYFWATLKDADNYEYLGSRLMKLP